MVGPDDTGAADDANGEKSSPPDISSDISSVNCSICLDLVTDHKDRSKAKLQCGHEFHLDCIGSAFNTKGVMQCPNCRNVERGRWLHANSCHRSFPDISLEDWNPDEEPYEFSHPELPFRIRWCPYEGFAPIQPSFGEEESPSTTYHDLQGHHVTFAEHTSSTSPVGSYFRGESDTTLRSSSRGESDAGVIRSGFIMPPFVNRRGHVPRGGRSSFVSPVYPGGGSSSGPVWPAPGEGRPVPRGIPHHQQVQPGSTGRPSIIVPLIVPPPGLSSTRRRFNNNGSRVPRGIVPLVSTTRAAADHRGINGFGGSSGGDGGFFLFAPPPPGLETENPNPNPNRIPNPNYIHFPWGDPFASHATGSSSNRFWQRRYL